MNKLIGNCVDFFAACGFQYAICAGYALELFSNMYIRPHSDIDVWIAKSDKEKALRYVFDRGFVLYENMGKSVFRLLENPYKQCAERFSIQAVKPDSSFIRFEKKDDGNYKLQLLKPEQTEFDFLDMMFNPQKDNRFIFEQNQNISREMEKALLYTSEKIPYMAPEVVLFCKSIYIDREGYQKDFDVTIPLLSQEQISWLLEALVTAYPDGHKWVDSLSVNSKENGN